MGWVGVSSTPPMNVKNGKLQLLLMTLCSPVFAQYSGRNTTLEELKILPSSNEMWGDDLKRVKCKAVPLQAHRFPGS